MDFDVFISHSSKDKTMADAVCARLEAAGIRCWIAPRDISPGMTWSGEIMRAIDKCKVMVLVFSSNANESDQIIREVEAIVHRGKPILPLRIENILPSDSMAYFMSSVHWLDALSEPLERHLEDLVQAVAALLGRETPKRDPKPTSIPVPPSPFNWKPIAYTAIGALVAIALLLFLLLRPKTTYPQLAVVTPPAAPTPAPAVSPTPAPASPDAAALASIPTPANVTPAPSANTGSTAAQLSGTWHLKNRVFDYDATSTLTFAFDGTYNMETVLSDSGTYQSAAGHWTTTSNGSGIVRQGTYTYAGSHWIKVTGPLGIALYSPQTPQAPLDPANPVMLGTWVSTVHPRGSAPWNMTLTNQPDGTYIFTSDIVDQGTFTSANGQYVMRSRSSGLVTQGTYRPIDQNSIEITSPVGPATWSRN